MLNRVCLFATLVLVAVTSFAQDTVRKIQPLDKVSVTCTEERLLNKTYSVSKDGVILMDFLGAVEIQGLSEPEAAEKISKKLVADRILRKATVALQRVATEGETTVPQTTPKTEPAQAEPTQQKLVGVKYSGAVKNTGELTFKEGLKLSDVVELAGPTESTDLEAVVVKSSDGSVKKVNTTNLNEIVILRAGDDVVFTAKPAAPTMIEVYVFGGVLKPGAVKLQSASTLRGAIEAAGGLESMAAKDKIRVERDGQLVQTIDLTQPSNDLVLLANDRITVDTVEKRAYVQVDGAVNNPGYFVVTSGMKLGEAITAAGGYSNKARLEKVEILSSGDAKPRIVNYREIEQGYSGDIVLKAGDVIKVPSAKSRNNTPVKIAAGVAAYLLIFRR